MEKLTLRNIGHDKALHAFCNIMPYTRIERIGHTLVAYCAGAWLICTVLFIPACMVYVIAQATYQAIWGPDKVEAQPLPDVPLTLEGYDDPGVMRWSRSIPAEFIGQWTIGDTGQTVSIGADHVDHSDKRWSFVAIQHDGLSTMNLLVESGTRRRAYEIYYMWGDVVASWRDNWNDAPGFEEHTLTRFPAVENNHDLENPTPHPQQP